MGKRRRCRKNYGRPPRHAFHLAQKQFSSSAKPNALERQQLQLARNPTRIATHRATRADNAMTRHENRNGIAPNRRRYGTHRRRRAPHSSSNASSQCAIGQGLSERYRQQFAPHRHLKIRTAPFHIRQRRQRQCARKIGRQPPTSRLDKGRESIKHSRLLDKVRSSRQQQARRRFVHGTMTFAHEPKSRKPTSPTGQQQMAERGSQ